MSTITGYISTIAFRVAFFKDKTGGENSPPVLSIIFTHLTSATFHDKKHTPILLSSQLRIEFE